MRRQIDNEMLEMALAGYQAKRDELMRAMAAIQQQLGGTRKSAPVAAAAAAPVAGMRRKRKLSAAGKRAIQEAVKRRWAEFHAKAGAVKPAAKKVVKAKRTISPAAKARLVANLAKARAAKASKQATEAAKA
jgi:hypothetical protein